MQIARSISIGQVDTAKRSANRDWPETRGVVAAVHHELRPGFFIHVTLGAAGLQVFRGEDCVGIPLDAIVELAGQVNPVFATEPVDTAAAIASVSALAAEPIQ